MLVVQALGYYAIYLITPYDLAWHLSYSAERIVLQIFPLLLFLVLAAAELLNLFSARTTQIETEQSMLLAIDVGNTNLTLGLYEGEKLDPHWRLATDPARMPDEYGLQFLGLLEHAGCAAGDLTGSVSPRWFRSSPSASRWLAANISNRSR